MSGGQTISNVEPAAGNLRVQTAVYGSAIPLIYGRARVSGNLAWYGGFTAIPHTSTQSSGGKGGGGVKSENTSFTYTAAVLMILGEGPINSIISGWKGKQRYDGVQLTSGVPRTITETVTVPPGGVVTVSQAASFLQNAQVTDSRSEAWDPGSWSA